MDGSVTFVTGTNRPNAGKKEDNAKSQQSKTTYQQHSFTGYGINSVNPPYVP
jgi:hypothetical protein